MKSLQLVMPGLDPGIHGFPQPRLFRITHPALGWRRRKEADDAGKPPARIEDHDIDAAPQDGAIGADRLPVEARDIVVWLDGARPLDARARPAREHGGDVVEQSGSPGSMHGRIGIEAAIRPDGIEQRSAPLRVGGRPGFAIAIDYGVNGHCASSPAARRVLAVSVKQGGPSAHPSVEAILGNKETVWQRPSVGNK